MYAIGKDEYGTLGKANQANTFIDTGFTKPVTKIACGYEFMAMIACGNLYVCGKNGAGQVLFYILLLLP